MTATVTPVNPLLDRDRWLQLRKGGIGSSDAAACLGVSPFLTPHLLYVEKVVGIEVPETPQMEWGRRLEDAIAAAAGDALGTPLDPPEGVYHSESVAWMFATPDRLVPRTGVPVEIKTSEAGFGFGRAMTDEVPLAYKAQVTHQAVVLGVDHAWLAVLIGGSDFRLYRIPVEPELARTLTEAEAEVWRRVVDRDPPPPDYRHPRTVDYLERVEPDEALPVAEGTAEQGELFSRYQELGFEINKREQERREVKARLLDAVGDRPGMRFPGHGKMLRRKVVQRAGYEVKASSFVELRAVLDKGV